MNENENELPIDDFEIIREGVFLVRRNTRLVDEVLAARRRKAEADLRMELNQDNIQLLKVA